MSEIMHWEPAKLEARLREALDMVERLDPPEDLRAHVFNNAANGLTGKTVLQPAPPILGGRLVP